MDFLSVVQNHRVHHWFSTPVKPGNMHLTSPYLDSQTPVNLKSKFDAWNYENIDYQQLKTPSTYSINSLDYEPYDPTLRSSSDIFRAFARHLTKAVNIRKSQTDVSTRRLGILKRNSDLPAKKRRSLEDKKDEWKRPTSLIQTPRDIYVSDAETESTYLSADRESSKPKKASFLKRFRRQRGKELEVSPFTTPSLGLLFGQPLEKTADVNGLPGRPVMELLTLLWEQGPTTDGVFRKSANVRVVKAVRESLDKGLEHIDTDEVNPYTAAALLKEYLRSLPDCLLASSLYEDWLQVPNICNEQQKLIYVLNLVSQLKPSHRTFLNLVLSVLKRIADHCEQNKMTSGNLAICIGPSLLFTRTEDYDPSVSISVRYLIEKCEAIFEESNLDVLRNSLMGVVTNNLLPTEPINTRCGQYSRLYSRNSQNSQNLDRETYDIPNSVTSSVAFCSRNSVTSSAVFCSRDSVMSSAAFYSRDSGLNSDDGNVWIDNGERSCDLTSVQSAEDVNENSRYFKQRRIHDYSRRSYYQRYRCSPSKNRKSELIRRRSIGRRASKMCDYKDLTRVSSEEGLGGYNTDKLCKTRYSSNYGSNLSCRSKLSSSNDSGIILYDFSNFPYDEGEEMQRMNLNGRNSEWLSADEVDSPREDRPSHKVINNNVEFTDEPLCSINSAEFKASEISKSKFQRKYGVRSKSKAKYSFV